MIKLVRPRSRPPLFSFLDLTPSHCDSATEVASYLAEQVIELSSNPLMFWKNLCLPATSAPVERVFLKARNITKADRS